MLKKDKMLQSKVELHAVRNVMGLQMHVASAKYMRCSQCSCGCMCYCKSLCSNKLRSIANHCQSNQKAYDFACVFLVCGSLRLYRQNEFKLPSWSWFAEPALQVILCAFKPVQVLEVLLAATMCVIRNYLSAEFLIEERI